MPYNTTDDPFCFTAGSPQTLGRVGRVISPSDAADITPYPKTVVVTAAGNLSVLPSQNADNVPITFQNAPVGFSPPYQVRRVFATGTTASVATVEA
jgi:hypothetical protein